MRIDRWTLLILSIIFVGCSQDLYKRKLIPDSKNKGLKNPYGAYMQLQTQSSQYVGEFITHSNDTLYLLTESGVVRKARTEIIRAEVFLTQNSSKKYLRITAISAIPSLLGAAIHSSEYGGSFLIFGTLTAIPGLIASAVESKKKSHTVSYPEESLESLRKYARYPIGIPAEVDINELSGSYMSALN